MSHSSTAEPAPVDGLRRQRTPEQRRANRRRRMPFLLLGLLFFVSALYAGLWRLGLNLPQGASLAVLHGPLMIGGFFGTLIGLERSVALGWPSVFLSPALSVLASLLALAGAPEQAVASLYLLAALILTAASLLVLRFERHLFTLVLASGAAAWAAGNVSWLLSGSIPDAAAWWMLFLVLTIAAERLEMSRLLGMTAIGRATFALCIAALVAGAAAGLFTAVGSSLLGLGLLSLSVWLVRHDIAFRNLRRAPHLRFFGICMSAGYGWLAIAGAALLLAPPAQAPFGYDLVLHAILIGFVLSMAFGHSIIVIPALTGAAAPYSAAMYVGLVLLHGSLVLRVVGDVLESPAARIASGPITLAGIVAFLVVLIGQIRRAARERTAQ